MRSGQTRYLSRHLRAAVRALIVANGYLLEEVDRLRAEIGQLRAAASHGFARGRLHRPSAAKAICPTADLPGAGSSIGRNCFVWISKVAG